MLAHGFPPLATPRATRLILGSLPGADSLRAGQYYAHPRNVFWRIMGELFGADPSLSYAARARTLGAAGIAVWDVIASCSRSGSLDAHIDRASVTLNDFASFLAIHRSITHVYFNGAAAEQLFMRLALPTVDPCALEFRRLPSTSPAHARLNFERKLAAWSIIRSF